MRALSSSSHRWLTRTGERAGMRTIAPHVEPPDAATAGDRLRQLELLTGPGAGDLLGAAVAAAGGRLVRWRARQVQPSASGVTASYHALVRWADATREETLAACTGELPSGALVLQRDDD